MLKRIFLAFLVAALGAAAWMTLYLLDLPDTALLMKENPKTTAIREYREAQVRDKGKKPRSSMVWRRLDQISPYLRHAVVLAEDDRFYHHNGFDLEQLRRAVRVNWERRRFAFGASTITQQLARTLYLSPRKNLLRKAKEALITVRLERTLPKKRILELYLNSVEWGPQVYGAEAAARHFFGKSAAELSAEESIALAVILPSPRRWSPHGDTKFLTRRRDALYARMVRANYIIPPVPAVTEPEREVEDEIPAEDEPVEDDLLTEDPAYEQAPPAPLEQQPDAPEATGAN